MELLKKLKAKYYGVPFEINNYWPYHHPRTDELGLKIKGVQDGWIVMKDNCKYEYKQIKAIRLKGGDFIGGTEYEYNLQFVKKI